MNINEKETIWMEKYRPTRVEDIVLPKSIKSKFQKYANNEDIPNLGLWSANPGTGKTSTATALIKEIGCEALFINASMDNGIDILRGRIANFASSESFDGKLKIVVLDEIDNLTPSAMFAFRNLIESFANNCRFILTGNYKEKIIEPLLDRLENYDYNSLNKQEMIKPIFSRLSDILNNENIEFNPKDLVPVMNTYYPSIRSMIGAIQKFSSDGKFTLNLSELDNQDEYQKIMNTLKDKDFISTINLVNDLNSPSNMYTFLYKHISQLPENKLPQIVISIAKYQFQDGGVRDKNLNLSACLTEIMSII